ncbi:DUF2345 domain-containing protein, partial [Brenneria goodwinii]
DGDISIGKSFRVAVRETLSLFAQRLGIKLLAAAGKVEVQAQSDAMDLLAQKQLTVASQDDRVVVTAKTELLLNCGGAFIRIKDGQIELGAPNNALLKTPVVQRMGSASIEPPVLPQFNHVADYNIRFLMTDDMDKPYVKTDYIAYFPDGTYTKGTTDMQGYTEVFTRSREESISIHLLQS